MANNTIVFVCKPCEKFFHILKFRCVAMLYGECDCPKCQGMCNCEEN